MPAPARPRRPLSPEFAEPDADLDAETSGDPVQLVPEQPIEADPQEWGAMRPWHHARVYRIWPLQPGMPSDRPCFVGQLFAGQGTEQLREQWGGGGFKVWFYNDSNKVLALKQIVLEGPPIYNGGATVLSARAEQRTPMPSSGGSELDRRFDALERRLEVVLDRTTASPATTPAPAFSSALSEVVALVKLVSELQQQNRPDPEQYLRWMRIGINAGKELDGNESERSTTDTLLELGKEWLETQKQRAQFAALASRRSTGAPRALPAQPPTAGSASARPVAAPRAPAPAGEGVRTKSPAPSWLTNLAVEIARAQSDGDDPSFTASWIERYCPAQFVDQAHALPPEVLAEQLMQLEPHVRRAGVELDRNFVNGIVSELLQLEGAGWSGEVVAAAPAPTLRVAEPAGAVDDAAPPASAGDYDPDDPREDGGEDFEDGDDLDGEGV